MSIFYNVKIRGNGEITDELSEINKNKTNMEFRTTRLATILEKQSDYQVGVCRFKLPSKNIPMFEVSQKIFDKIPQYQQYCFYQSQQDITNFNGEMFENNGGYLYRSQPAFLNGEGLSLRLCNKENLINQGINTNGYLSNQQFLTIKNTYNGNLKINDVDGWIQHLNSMSLSAYTALNFMYLQNNTAWNNTGGVNRNGNMTIGEGKTLGSMVFTQTMPYAPHIPQTHKSTLPTLNSNESFYLTMKYPTANNGTNIPSKKIINFCITISNVEFDNTVNNVKINAGTKDLIIRLHSPSDSSGKRQSWLISNGFGSDSQTKMENNILFSPMFPKSIENIIGNNDNGLSKIPSSRINTLKVDILAKPSYDDFSSFYSKIEADSGNANNGNGWLVEVLNVGRGILKAGMTLNLDLFSEIQNSKVNEYQNSPYSALSIPSYSFDNTKGLININTPIGYFKELVSTATSGVYIPPDVIVRNRQFFKIFFNYNLQDLFNWNFQEVPNSYTKETNFDLDNPTPYQKINTINKQGGFMSFPSDSLNRLNVEDSHILTYNEYGSSSYLRRSIQSIIIASNILSVEGEVIGDGNESRKILTDFEPDVDDFPTYYQFETQGFMRYYKLKSNQPLREIGLKVYYETIFNELKTLEIPNGSSGSIKIEFRPNDMIQNY